MSIKLFIKHSEGKWVVQRTTYDFQSNQVWNLQSNTTIKQLSNQKMISKYYKESDVYICLSLMWGLYTSYYNLNIYPDKGDLGTCAGKIVELNATYGICARRTYYFTSNLFNIYLSSANFFIREKLWFAGNNLVLGISIVQYNNYYVLISFESQIRT